MKFTNEEILKNKVKQHRRKKVILVIMSIIIIPIIIYNVLLMLEKNVLPDIGVNIKIPQIIVIDSEDMEPTLNIGDIILIKYIEEEDIKENDIIVFKEGENIITHRVVDILDTDNGKKFVTKDNSNVESSGIVKYSNIEGKYQEIKIPKIGKLVLFMKNKIAIISILIIFLLIYIHDINKKIKSQIRREKREQFNLAYKRTLE